MVQRIEYRFWNQVNVDSNLTLLIPRHVILVQGPSHLLTSVFSNTMGVVTHVSGTNYRDINDIRNAYKIPIR